MAIDSPTRLRVEQYLAWANQPENSHRRTELVHGEVIEMPPPGDLHGTLCSWIASLLWLYAMQRRSGRVSANDCAIRLSDDTLYGVDVLFFRQSRPMDQISPGPTEELPTLAVEVASPSNQWSELQSKAEDYLNFGIPVVWLVDPSRRGVEVYQAGASPRMLYGADSLGDGGHLPELNLTVADLFNWPQPRTAA